MGSVNKYWQYVRCLGLCPKLCMYPVVCQPTFNTSSAKPIHIYIIWTHTLPHRCTNNCLRPLQWQHMDGLVQERRNSIANILELHLSCTNPSIWMSWHYDLLTTEAFVQQLVQANNEDQPDSIAMNTLMPSDEYPHQWTWLPLVLDTKPLPEPMLTSIWSFEKNLNQDIIIFIHEKGIWIYCLQNVRHFVSASICKWLLSLLYTCILASASMPDSGCQCQCPGSTQTCTLCIFSSNVSALYRFFHPITVNILRSCFKPGLWVKSNWLVTYEFKMERVFVAVILFTIVSSLIVVKMMFLLAILWWGPLFFLLRTPISEPNYSLGF